MDEYYEESKALISKIFHTSRELLTELDNIEKKENEYKNKIKKYENLIKEEKNKNKKETQRINDELDSLHIINMLAYNESEDFIISNDKSLESKKNIL